MTLCPSPSQVYVPEQITGYGGGGGVETDPWKGEMPSHSGWAWLVGGGIFQLVDWAQELICRVEPGSLGRSTYAPGASLAWRRIPLMAHKETPWQVEKESLEEKESFIFLNRGQFSHFHSILCIVNNAASPDTDTKRLGLCDYKIDQWAYLSQFPIFHLLLCLMKSWENIWPFSSPVIHLLFQLYSKCVLHIYIYIYIYIYILNLLYYTLGFWKKTSTYSWICVLLLKQKVISEHGVLCSWNLRKCCPVLPFLQFTHSKISLMKTS